MQKSLKNSLYLGLAALSFVAAAGVATTSASAASKATVTSNTTMTTAASTRNVNLTGTNALYTKPGTVKGAKLVATTATAKRLGDSKKSLDNFRAYRVAVTSRGSVYYKVVSFDQDYRGWVYGGKTSGTFAAGVKSFDTFNEGTTTSAQTSNYYSFKTPAAEAGGKANYAKAGTSVTYTQPAWTQYKVGRAVTTTANSTVKDLVISKTGTRGKEGDTWVYVTSASTPAVNGWILESSLTKEGSYTPAADGVTVNYYSQATSTSASTKLGSVVVPVDANGVAKFGAAADAGYKAALAGVRDGYTAAPADIIAFGTQGKGNSVNLIVNQNPTVNQGSNIKLTVLGGSLGVRDIQGYVPANVTTAMNKAKFTGVAGTVIKASDVDAFAKASLLAPSFTGIYGKTYTYNAAATAAALNGAKYDGTATATNSSVTLYFTTN
ncbi:hypothetical protein [Secundilactobacillus malefermentans]|uniref:hypothetical protein n=1 Tax=Secundilactobacillus malefermentans TaxID=176292 RepID=UPI0011C9F6D5|nr:hypothetical protein [Secundilactobacillus malefermentans]QEA31754.1 hypothetical protein FGL90_05905 [Secundilactobacillus malefermentans]